MNNLNFNKIIDGLPFGLLLFFMFPVVYILDDRLPFTMVGGLIGFFGSRSLENQKNKRERYKIAKVILAVINNEKSNVDNLIISIKSQENFIDNFIYNRSLREAFFKLNDENLYNAVSKDLGIFELDIILEIVGYFTDMKLALKLQSDLLQSYSDIPHLNKEEIKDVLKQTYTQLQAIKITGIKCMILLGKKVLNENANFKEFNQTLIEDYQEIKKQLPSPSLNQAAEKIESIFKLCGKLDELRNIT